MNTKALIESFQTNLNEESYVEHWRNEVKKYREKENEYIKKGISRTDSLYRDTVYLRKDANKHLKEGLAKEKGTFVKPGYITRLLKKELEIAVYKDSASDIRGYHINATGDFKVNSNDFVNDLSEDALYYEIMFYAGKRSD